MENSMEDSQKISTPVWPSYYISGYLSEEHENTNLKRYMHPCVHCTIIYCSQDTETAYVYISGWIDKDVTYIYKRMKSCYLQQHGWTFLEGIMLGEVSWRKTKRLWFHQYVES